ncbi:MBL fold metallo-hydrolase [Ideonella sp. DXS29W]|uniref:MBL fold metallo-hydrolase n=1 Tax=Ideonella lacteola TaxID=2984193 RepID=A0ABU9BX80_9BURK
MTRLHAFTRTALAALVFTGIAAGSAVAQTPPPPALAKAQAGYVRMMLGDAEVTSLSDGTVVLSADILTGAKPQHVQDLLKQAHQTGPLHTSVNAYLVKLGDKLVLVDTGAGGFFGPSLNKLQASMKAAGYTPDQVTDIVITHLHADHVGGLVNGDAIQFPNANVHADKAELDFWLDTAKMDAAPKGAQGFFKMAQAALTPYVKAGKVKPFTGATEIVPGLRTQPTHGHTPGHSFYVLESKGQKLVFWGDLMHFEEVQFPDPTVTVAFDTDSKSAKAQRLAAFADAAKQGYLVAPSHVTFPGIGHLRKQGSGYVWLPVRYVNDAH